MSKRAGWAHSFPTGGTSRAAASARYRATPRRSASRRSALIRRAPLSCAKSGGKSVTSISACPVEATLAGVAN